MGFGMRTDNVYQFLKTSARGRNRMLSSKCAIKEPFRSTAQTCSLNCCTFETAIKVSFLYYMKLHPKIEEKLTF